MNIEERYLTDDRSVLHYIKAGHGPENLLFFHGFGQDNTIFQSFIPALETNYTLYIFDLFLFGKSKWSAGEKPLEKEYWREVLDAFLRENKIERFSLVGFSMGGKFALATLEFHPEKTDSIFLIAPDGVTTNFWYRLATSTYFFRKLFRSMVLNPHIFFSLARAANRFGLVDKSLLRFVEQQMNTEEKRKKAYYSWVVFRQLKFKLKPLAETITSHKIRTIFILGAFDKVIPKKSINRILPLLEDYEVEILPTGHNGLLNVKNLLKFLPIENQKRP